MTQRPHTVAIVDDHLLLSGSLEKLINSFDGFKVIYHASNGRELQQKIKRIQELPEIILLDINMPVMDGFETVEWLTANHPGIRVLALSMEDEERTILKMLQKGAKGYLLKDITPEKLHIALQEVVERGYYHSEKVAATLLHSIQPSYQKDEIKFKANELTFLQLACSEMTYKEIADVMSLSPKTIDGYRQELFNKLNIKNRVGLVIYALKNNLIKI